MRWWLLLFGVSGCSGESTRPHGEEVGGAYILERVDGVRLPAPLPGEPGCTRSATYGELELSPQIRNRRPLYTWFVQAVSSCQGGSPPVENTQEEDFGSWSLAGRRVAFVSQAGRPGYSGEVTAALEATIESVTGRSYTFRRVRAFDDPVGYLSVAAVDGSGNFVNGTLLDIRAPDGLKLRAGTNNNRPFLTGGPAGTWTVTAAPPEGFVIAPSQPHPAAAQVTVGNTTELRIVLAPAGP